MPKPMSDQPQPVAPQSPEWPAARDHEMAVTLPDWDLLPPAEFIVRHTRS